MGRISYNSTGSIKMDSEFSAVTLNVSPKGIIFSFLKFTMLLSLTVLKILEFSWLVLNT